VKLLGAVVMSAMSVVPSRALDPGPQFVIAAGPASKSVGYATPVAVAQVGAPLAFVNADIEEHNVASCRYVGSNLVCDTGPDTQPWCEFYAPGKCPLFWSEWKGLGVWPVWGLENAVPGKTYGFYCEKHGSAQQGLLVVLPGA
jgi:hypothetical protein